MNDMLFKNGTLLIAGGLAGGFLGNLVISWVIYNLEDSEYEDPEYAKEDSIEENKTSPTNYASRFKVDKGRLDDLAASYKTSIPDLTYKPVGINIVSEEEHTSTRRPAGIEDEIIYYFDEDSVFINENEEIIDNPNEKFGPNIHLKFGSLNDDPDIVYVRNNNVNVDYEIIRRHTSYSVEILGEEPKEVAKPKRTRKPKNSIKEQLDEGDGKKGE